MRWPSAAFPGLLLAALAPSAVSAGPPPDVTGHSSLGDAFYRASVAYANGERHTEQGPASIFLRLGPNGYCFDVVPWGEFQLNLLGVGALLRVEGGLQAGRRGVGLEPDAVALRDALAARVEALCAQEHGAPACGETFGALEPRLGRTRLALRTRERGDGIQARLRGRLELLFVDPTTELAEVRARFAFRDARGLELIPPANVSGVCITVFPYFPYGG